MKRIGLIGILFLAAAAAFAATPKRAITLTNFNAGELSPQMEGRTDFPKYITGARTLQNMLVRSQGPAARRPGTKYIAEVKDSNDITRLIPFEYSTSDAYILELGDDYIRFYRNGAQVLSGASAYELVSPWDANDIFEIQFAQDAQTMRLVHPDYQPRKLVRNSASHTDWTLSAISFEGGPFLDENEDTTSLITPSAATGTVTLDCNDNIWNANHVGALWQITHLVDSNTISGRFWGPYTVVGGDVAAMADEDGDGTYEANSVPVTVYENQDYTVTTGGLWWGNFKIQRSYDDGATWNTVKTFSYQGNGNVLYAGTEEEEDAVYRVRMDDQMGVSGHMVRHNEGMCDWTVATDPFLRHGVVRIASYVDPNEVTATVLTELGSTDATWRWAEGVWSAHRGWPRTIEHHEQRCLYGGSAGWPQTIWASITASQDGDYDDFDPGVADAADAWTYVLPGMNPIQWMVSSDYLMVGTTDGVGRLGSPDKPISPAWPAIFRTQARNGAAYIDAIAAGDTILYVERGGEKVREVSYTYAEDRYTAGDMTILAEHIAKGGITQIGFQERPDPILWCVRSDGVLLSFTYQRKHEVLAWARHITGQDPNDLTSWDDFESVAVIPGTSARANGDTRNDDELWAVVKRTVDSNEVRYVEQFQPLDWGTDPNYCWFVDCAGYGLGTGVSGTAGALTEGVAQYPTLQALTAGEIPAVPANPSLTAAVSTVANAAQLQAMTGNGKYRLTVSIDLTAVVWTPISTTASGFVLDGDGYTISNLTINQPASHNQGLFASLSAGCQVYDLTFQDCSVTGNSDVGILSGGMPGTGTFTLSNVDTNDCTVVGQSYVGGLVGYIEDVTAGGIYDCEVTNCTITCADTGGGMTGEILMNAASTANFNVVRSDVVGGTVTVSGGYTNGGFIGEAEGDYSQYYVYFHTCTSSAALTVAGASTDGHGGFAGISDYARWVSCSATGAVTTTDARGFIGGFVGFETGYGPGYTNCYATGAVNVTETAGPLAPYLVGGFIGKFDNIGACPVLRCYATGNVTVTCTGMSDWYGVGGFIGGVLSTGTNGGDTIQRSWSTGDVYIDDEDGYDATRKGGRGGFIGTVSTSGVGAPATLLTVQNCYAWGSLLTADSSDEAARGGFIGSFDKLPAQSQTVVLTNCYCAQTNTATGSSLTNQITAGTYRGGFAGWNDSFTLTTTASYYDQTTSGTTTSAAGTNHLTPWMMTQSNYSAAGWDFATIWYMPAAAGNEWSGMTWLAGDAVSRDVCVYADARPLSGSWEIDANGVLDPNGDFDIIIAGINYYSILETMPLVDAETQGRDTQIKSVAVDFVESMGAHVGSSQDYATDWLFSGDDFATSIDPFSGYKPRTGYAGFMRPMTRKPVVYVWVWDCVPMSIRSITANLEITFE